MATITSVKSWSWQDTTTWDSWTIPWIWDKVIIEKDHIVITEWDIDFWTWQRSTSTSSSVSTMEIYWTLKFSRTQNTNFWFRWMIYCRPRNANDQSTIDIWTEQDPIPENIKIVINVNKDDYFYYYGNYRSFWIYYYWNNYQPIFTAVSAKYRTRHTTLTQPVSAGDNVIYVEDATWWEVWDTLNLSPKYDSADNYNAHLNTNVDIVTIASVNGNEITLNETLEYDHWYNDEDDKIIAAVWNYTSNIVFTAWKESNMFPSIVAYWCKETIIKNVEFAYCNNSYYYNQWSFVTYKPNSYWDFKFENNAMWSYNRLSNLPWNWKEFFVLLYPWQDHLFSFKNNVFSAFFVEQNNNWITANKIQEVIIYFNNWYRKLSIDNCLIQNWKVRLGWGYKTFQVPVSFNNSKVIWAEYWINIQSTFEWKSKNLTIAWFRYANYCLSKYSIKNEKIRYGRQLLSMPWWNASYLYLQNIDYQDKHLYYTDYDNINYISTSSQIDQIEINYKFLQNDGKKIITYYASWYRYDDYVNIRDNPYSQRLKNKDGKFPIRYSYSFEAKQWDAIITWFYVNSSSYNWVLKVRMTQWDKVYTDTTIDLSWYTPNEWTFVPFTAQAVYTLEVDVEIGYIWIWEINIADIVKPASTTEKQIARAVWNELTSENKIDWTFGKVLPESRDWAKLAATQKFK